MKKITITVVFNEWGHGYINVIPTNYVQWNPVASDKNEYNLDPGSYTITYNTVTGDGGSITITDHNGNVLASQPLEPGMDQGYFKLTI
jgi:hypothetical protein